MGVLPFRCQEWDVSEMLTASSIWRLGKGVSGRGQGWDSASMIPNFSARKGWGL